MFSTMSIAIVILAISFVYCLKILRRLNDWRAFFLPIMISCLLLYAFSLLVGNYSKSRKWLFLPSDANEIAVFVISLTAFFSAFFVWQVFSELLQKYKQTQSSNNKLTASNNELKGELTAVRDLLKQEINKRYEIEVAMQQTSSYLEENGSL